jgi:uncharacterized protein YodC (DUF2158 family)
MKAFLLFFIFLSGSCVAFSIYRSRRPSVPLSWAFLLAAIHRKTAMFAQKSESFLIQVRTWLFGHKSEFKKGDSVQLQEGGELMLVIDVYTNRNLSGPLVECRWYEPATKEIRTQIFQESRLKFFDWHHALVALDNGAV